MVKSQPLQNKKKSNRRKECNPYIRMNLMNQIITGLVNNLDQEH